MEIRSSNAVHTGPLARSASTPLPTEQLPSEQLPAEASRNLEADPASEPSTVSRKLEEMVGKSVLEPFVTADLQTIADFEKLQAEGKLTSEVMAGLEQLAVQPLAAGIDRTTLIATALRQMADPSSVNQGDKFTCAPAVVQTMVAKDDPAEYLRLVAGLASPEGEVTLQNGASITRDANWQSDPTRSVIDNLMQPALMQYATGSYDSVSDTRQTAKGSGQGLYAAEQDKLIEAVTARKSTSILGSGPEVLGQLAKATAAGQNVPAIIKYQDANGEIKGHAVLVESVKNGMVSYLDPKEGRKSISLEEFQGKLQSVSLPDAFVTPKLAAVAMKDGEGLLAGGFGRRLRRAFRRITSGISKAFKAIGNTLKRGFDLIADIHKKIFEMQKKLFFKVVDFIAPALPILSVAAWLIPGVGPVIGTALKIAQGVVAGANAIRALESGNLRGAITAGLSAFSGVMSGPAAGVAAKWASYANTATNVVDAIKSGNVAGAIGAIAGATGNQTLSTVANVAGAVQNKDVGAALGALGAATGNQTLSTVGNVASAVQNKDAGAALGALGAATGNQTLKSAAALANTAQQIKHAVDSKDFLGAAMSVNGLAIDAQLISASQGQEAQRWLERGQTFEQARRTGDTGQMLDLAAQTAGDLGVVTPKEYQKALPKLKQGLELYQAAKRGDGEAALQLGANALSSAGLIDKKAAQTAQQLAEQSGALRQAIAAKDFASAAKVAARMGYDAGVMGLTDPEALKKVEETAQRAARLNEGLQAARSGKRVEAAKIADEVFTDGRIMREVEELQQALEVRAREFANQAKQKVTGR